MGMAMLKPGSYLTWAGQLAVLELPSDELACSEKARIGRESETNGQLTGSLVGSASQHGRTLPVQQKKSSADIVMPMGGNSVESMLQSEADRVR